MQKVRVLFVCLGNICRSPMAEGLFQYLVREAGLEDRIECDSCGTSNYHIGELPDIRMRRTAEQNGILLESRARQFRMEDFEDFDYILPMDKSNERDITVNRNSEAPGKAKVMLMREFDPRPESMDVPDPYWSGKEGFIEVFQILRRSNEQFLDHLRKTHHL